MSSPVYFPPLFVADTLRSAWPCGRASHREAAFSGRQSAWPRQRSDAQQSTTPTPRGGEAARPAVSRETAGIPSLPATDGTDVPEQSTTHRLMTTSSALQDPTPPLFRRCRGVRRPYLARDATSHVGSERSGNDSEERLLVQPHPTDTVQRLPGPLGLCSFHYALLRYRLGSTSTNISYASLRSRDTASAAARQPLPVFHVKPRESQRLSVSDLLTSETLVG